MASSETLPRAIAVRSRGSWNEAARDFVRLDFDNRHRRRVRMQGRHGLTFLLDLADATALRDGDALVLDDGTLVEIEAAKEPLVEVSGASPDLMIRIAWHLGNRHLPVQLVPGALRIRRDHVIEAMIERLGGRLRAVEAAFDPEGGAYVEHPHHHAHAHSD